MNDVPADPELLRKGLIEGDEIAWRTLYRLYTPGLYRLATYLADSETEAQDLVHEMWLRASRGASRFAERSSLRTWLTGILVNCVREWRRSSLRLAEVALDDDLPADPGPALAAAELVDLERGLAGLAPGYRAVLLLHDVEGYTHQEIADLLGIEAGTSKSQLTRARRAMLRALAIKEGVTRG